MLTARNFSLDEIMNKIIGMGDKIHQLLQAMYSNTPKDLIPYWGGHPKVLLEAMGKYPRNEDNLFHVPARKWMQDVGSVELRLP